MVPIIDYGRKEAGEGGKTAAGRIRAADAGDRAGSVREAPSSRQRGEPGGVRPFSDDRSGCRDRLARPSDDLGPRPAREQSHRSPSAVLPEDRKAVGARRRPSVRQVRRAARPGSLRDPADRRHRVAPDRPADARHGRHGGVRPHPGHGPGQRRRDRVLDRVGRGEVGPRGRRLLRRGRAVRPDRPARSDRPAPARGDDHGAGKARARAAGDPGRRRRTRGGSRCTPWRSATSRSRPISRTR